MVSILSIMNLRMQLAVEPQITDSLVAAKPTPGVASIPPKINSTVDATYQKERKHFQAVQQFWNVRMFSRGGYSDRTPESLECSCKCRRRATGIHSLVSTYCHSILHGYQCIREDHAESSIICFMVCCQKREKTRCFKHKPNTSQLAILNKLQTEWQQDTSEDKSSLPHQFIIDHFWSVLKSFNHSIMCWELALM